VESAYYAGPEHDSAANLRKLAEVMHGVPEGRRAAYFYCVLVLRGPAGSEQAFEGRCDGVLAPEPAGGAGFGYDPLFIPAGYDCTYAQLGEAEKNKISHRARAFAALARWLQEKLPAQGKVV
jgi:XTP/dITP diphosphohydrolase